MSSKMKRYLAMAMAMSMMSGQTPMFVREGTVNKKVERLTPKGYNHYYFNNKGEIIKNWNEL